MVADVHTSSAVRTNDSATRSTPIDSPNRSISRSSAGTAGSPRVEPGMLRPCRVPTRAADLDRGVDLAHAFADRRDAQANRPIGQVDDVLGVDRAGEAAPARPTSARRRPSSFRRRIGGRASRRASARPMSPSSAPIRSFGPGQILEDRTWRPTWPRPRADPLDVLGMQLAIAVGEVQAGDVEPGLDHRASVSGSREAGPIVATIFVRRMPGKLLHGAVRRPLSGRVVELDASMTARRRRSADRPAQIADQVPVQGRALRPPVSG